MKYKPEPINTMEEIEKAIYQVGSTKPVHSIPLYEEKVTKWKVEYEKDGGYVFESQDDAMTFCLLLEIRDLLKEIKSAGG